MSRSRHFKEGGRVAGAVAAGSELASGFFEPMEECCVFCIFLDQVCWNSQGCAGLSLRSCGLAAASLKQQRMHVYSRAL